MNISEVRNISLNEMYEMLNKLQRDYFRFRMQKEVGDFAKLHLLKKTRRDIARVRTLIRSKI